MTRLLHPFREPVAEALAHPWRTLGLLALALLLTAEFALLLAMAAVSS